MPRRFVPASARSTATRTEGRYHPRQREIRWKPLTLAGPLRPRLALDHVQGARCRPSARGTRCGLTSIVPDACQRLVGGRELDDLAHLELGELLLVDAVEPCKFRRCGVGVACQAREVVAGLHLVVLRAGLGGRGRGRFMRRLRGRLVGRFLARCRNWFGLWRRNAGRLAGPREKENDEYVYGYAASACYAPSAQIVSVHLLALFFEAYNLH